MSRTLGPGTLTFGTAGTAKQFAGDMTKVTLTPTTNGEDDIPLFDGSNESGEETTTWEIGGTILDDYTAGSLAVWAANNAGTELAFVFTPATGGDVIVSGTARIRPIAIGGDVKKKNTNDFAFPVVGTPTFDEV